MSFIYDPLNSVSDILCIIEITEFYAGHTVVLIKEIKYPLLFSTKRLETSTLDIFTKLAGLVIDKPMDFDFLQA